MKVYVDEFPKDCWDCPMHDGENGWCKMLVCYTDYIPKDCPLQPLTDHDKQVRKEVCEEIWKEFETRLMNKTEDIPVMKVANMINSVLDKVKEETK